MVQLLIDKNIGLIKKIIIDGDKPKWEEYNLKKILRDNGVIVKKLKAVKDEAEPCIRLADGLASLIRSYYDNLQGKITSRLFKLYQNKITAQLMGGQIIE